VSGNAVPGRTEREKKLRRNKVRYGGVKNETGIIDPA